MLKILEELRYAEMKHPEWAEDRLRRTAVLVEEAGEALQAQLNLIEAKERPTGAKALDTREWKRLDEKLVREVAQTGAMALRWLINHAEDQTEPRP